MKLGRKQKSRQREGKRRLEGSRKGVLKPTAAYLIADGLGEEAKEDCLFLFVFSIPFAFLV